jgi:hypothetical protein
MLLHLFPTSELWEKLYATEKSQATFLDYLDCFMGFFSHLEKTCDRRFPIHKSRDNKEYFDMKNYIF